MMCSAFARIVRIGAKEASPTEEAPCLSIGRLFDSLCRDVPGHV